MHDAFMDSLNAKGKEETKIEEIGHARKQIFLRRFVEALFSFNGNDDNIPRKELTFDNISAKESVSKGEDEMLREVRTLPNERKISVLNSILWGVIGVRIQLLKMKMKSLGSLTTLTALKEPTTQHQRTNWVLLKFQIKDTAFS